MRERAEVTSMSTDLLHIEETDFLCKKCFLLMCLFCTDDEKSQHVLNIFSPIFAILSDVAAGQTQQQTLGGRTHLCF